MKLLKLFFFTTCCFFQSPLSIAAVDVSRHDSEHHYEVKAVSLNAEHVIFTKSEDYLFESDRQYFALIDGKEFALTDSYEQDNYTLFGFATTEVNAANAYLYNEARRELSIFDIGTISSSGKLTQTALKIPADLQRVSGIFALGEGLLISSGNVRNTHAYFFEFDSKKLTKKKILKKGERILDAASHNEGYVILVLSLDEEQIFINIMGDDDQLLDTVSYKHSKPINNARLMSLTDGHFYAAIEETTSGIFSFNYGTKFSKVTFDFKNAGASATEIFSADAIRNKYPRDALLQCKTDSAVYWIEQTKSTLELKNDADMKKQLEWPAENLPIRSFLKSSTESGLKLVVNFSRDANGYYNNGFKIINLRNYCHVDGA